MYRVSASPLPSAPYVNFRWDRVGWTILVVFFLTISIMALYITPHHSENPSLEDALYASSHARGFNPQKDPIIAPRLQKSQPTAEKKSLDELMGVDTLVLDDLPTFATIEALKAPQPAMKEIKLSPEAPETQPVSKEQTQYNYDGSKGPLYDKASQITEYENLIFCTITPSFFNDQVADMIRSFVGGIHQLRHGLHHVPRIDLIMGVAISDLPVEFLEEISWWNNVHMHNLQFFLGLSIDPQMPAPKDEIVRLAVLDRLVKEHGHAIWIKFGYVFEPVWIPINDAEKKGNYQQIVDAYAAGRDVAMKLAIDLQQEGFIVGQQAKNVHYSSFEKLDHSRIEAEPHFNELYKVGDTIIEGYSRINSHEKMVEKKLECLFTKEGCKKNGPVQLTDDAANKYGVYPVNPLSRSACHTDIRPESILNTVLVKPVAETSLTDRSKRLLEENGTRRIRKIALGLPVTSRGREGKDPVFLEVLLPSLLQTVSEAELSSSLITLYLGFDHGDQAFQEKQSRDKILASSANLIGNRPIQLKMLQVPTVNRVAMVWNQLYIHSIRDGNQYFYQVNDDLQMVTPNWLTSFTSALDATGGFGVVGPSDHNHEWNCTLLTQAMVTPTHFDIFHYLYPIELKNWTTDRWLTEVYAPNHKHCTTKIIATNGKANRRYRACDFLGWVVYVQVGKKILADWMAEHPQHIPKHITATTLASHP